MGIFKTITSNILQKLNKQVAPQYDSTVAYPIASCVNEDGIFKYTPTATTAGVTTSFHETNAVDYIKAFIDAYTSNTSDAIVWSWDSTNSKPLCKFLSAKSCAQWGGYYCNGNVSQEPLKEITNENDNENTSNNLGRSNAVFAGIHTSTVYSKAIMNGKIFHMTKGQRMIISNADPSKYKVQIVASATAPNYSDKVTKADDGSYYLTWSGPTSSSSYAYYLWSGAEILEHVQSDLTDEPRITRTFLCTVGNAYVALYYKFLTDPGTRSDEDFDTIYNNFKIQIVDDDIYDKAFYTDVHIDPTGSTTRLEAQVSTGCCLVGDIPVIPSTSAQKTYKVTVVNDNASATMPIECKILSGTWKNEYWSSSTGEDYYTQFYDVQSNDYYHASNWFLEKTLYSGSSEYFISSNGVLHCDWNTNTKNVFTISNTITSEKKEQGIFIVFRNKNAPESYDLNWADGFHVTVEEYIENASNANMGVGSALNDSNGDLYTNYDSSYTNYGLWTDPIGAIKSSATQLMKIQNDYNYKITGYSSSDYPVSWTEVTQSGSVIGYCQPASERTSGATSTYTEGTEVQLGSDTYEYLFGDQYKYFKAYNSSGTISPGDSGLSYSFSDIITGYLVTSTKKFIRNTTNGCMLKIYKVPYGKCIKIKELTTPHYNTYVMTIKLYNTKSILTDYFEVGNDNRVYYKNATESVAHRFSNGSTSDETWTQTQLTTNEVTVESLNQYYDMYCAVFVRDDTQDLTSEANYLPYVYPALTTNLSVVVEDIDVSTIPNYVLSYSTTSLKAALDTSKHAYISNTPTAYNTTITGDQTFTITINDTTSTARCLAFAVCYSTDGGATTSETTTNYYNGTNFLVPIKGIQSYAQTVVTAGGSINVSQATCSAYGSTVTLKGATAGSDYLYKVFLHFEDSSASHTLAEYQSLFTFTVS